MPPSDSFENAAGCSRLLLEIPAGTAIHAAQCNVTFVSTKLPVRRWSIVFLRRRWKKRDVGQEQTLIDRCSLPAAGPGRWTREATIDALSLHKGAGCRNVFTFQRM